MNPTEQEMGVTILYDPRDHSMTLHLVAEDGDRSTVCFPIAEFARLAQSMLDAVAAATRHDGRAN